MSGLSPASVFITGSSRGLGLEFVKRFCGLKPPPKYIFATCRNPESAKDLQTLAENNASIHVMKLDVTDYSAIPGVVDYVKGVVGSEGLNLLINNAGINSKNTSLDQVTPNAMRDEYETNCIGPVILVQAFQPLLHEASKYRSSLPLGCSRAAIINISSILGSIERTNAGRTVAYRASKAALNMTTKCESEYYLQKKITAYAIHPGWVQTDMGGPRGDIDINTALDNIMSVLAKLGEAENGRFISYNGEHLPW